MRDYKLSAALAAQIPDIPIQAFVEFAPLHGHRFIREQKARPCEVPSVAHCANDGTSVLV
jgi:hypothetical protein